MGETLKWNGEKKTYQPRIKADQIHDLHTLKELNHKPMTVILNEALSWYLASFVNLAEYKKEEAAATLEMDIIDRWDNSIEPDPDPTPEL